MPFLSAARKAQWQREYMPGYMAECRRLVRETPWDALKYPDRKAWERALLKCEGLRRKAIKHPHLVWGVGWAGWDFNFQYKLAVEKGIKEGSKRF
jgi:hypothetical protein